MDSQPRMPKMLSCGLLPAGPQARDLRRRLRRRYGSHPEVTEFDEQASQLLGSR